MSRNSDDEYLSADEDKGDETLLESKHPDASESVTEPSDLQTVSGSTNNTSNVQEQQPEVVKVPDNKYVSDAESLKSGGVVELTEEQRKVSPRGYSMSLVRH